MTEIISELKRNKLVSNISKKGWRPKSLIDLNYEIKLDVTLISTSTGGQEARKTSYEFSSSQQGARNDCAAMCPQCDICGVKLDYVEILVDTSYSTDSFAGVLIPELQISETFKLPDKLSPYVAEATALNTALDIATELKIPKPLII